MVGVHEMFMRPLDEESNVSPDTVLEINVFAPPDRQFYALVLKRTYEYMFHPKCWSLA